MTQEALAEALNVSRQSVSKWESDGSFPEMEKLLQICDMFSCSMDTLLKGNAEQEMTGDNAGYDKHMNSFAKSIAAGVFTVLFGVSAAGFMDGMGVKDGITGMVFMTFVLVAVLIFVVSGMNHDNFRKNNPSVNPIYKAEETAAFEKKFPVMIAVGIGVILLGLIITIGLDELIEAPKTGLLTAAENSVLLFTVSLGAPLMTYAGIQKEKYDIDKYNRENSPEEKERMENSPYQKLYSIIMIIATMVFLLLGFLGDLWRYSWISFVVGGLLCGIVGILEGGKK